MQACYIHLVTLPILRNMDYDEKEKGDERIIKKNN